MRKIKILLVILLMILCVDVSASAPAILDDFSTYNQGDIIVIETKAVSGNTIGMHNVELQYSYDSSVVEFVSFENEYGLKYDPQTMYITRDSHFTLDTYTHNIDDAVLVWTMKFKVKDDAKIGYTVINNKIYSIVEKTEKEEPVVENVKEENIVEENINSETKDISIFFITTIIFGVIALIELIYIVVKKNKKV